MSRYTGPKDKLSRREGFDLFGKGAKLTRLTVPPGVHGPKGVRNLSAYGRQLREKQKAKRLYGVTEKKFKKYVASALAKKINSVDFLASVLETRLDNVVFRLGLAPSRPAARQLITHKHVLVNGTRLNIPSYKVQAGDIVTLSGLALEIPHIKVLLSKDKDEPRVSWLSKKGPVGKVSKIPTAEDILEPISIQDIIEFYSR